MDPKKKPRTWLRTADFVRLVIFGCWLIGMFAVVGAANRSGSLVQGGVGFFLLTAGAAGGLWIVRKVASPSGM